MELFSPASSGNCSSPLFNIGIQPENREAIGLEMMQGVFRAVTAGVEAIRRRTGSGNSEGRSIDTTAGVTDGR